jgi:Mn-containing catalase
MVAGYPATAAPNANNVSKELRENNGEKNIAEGQRAVDGDKPFTHEQHTATT